MKRWKVEAAHLAVGVVTVVIYVAVAHLLAWLPPHSPTLEGEPLGFFALVLLAFQSVGRAIRKTLAEGGES